MRRSGARLTFNPNMLILEKPFSCIREGINQGEGKSPSKFATRRRDERRKQKPLTVNRYYKILIKSLLHSAFPVQGNNFGNMGNSLAGEADLVLPSQVFNLLQLMASFVLLFWGYCAYTKLMDVLTVRAAILTGHQVAIQRLGPDLETFRYTDISHVDSVLQVRLNAAPKECSRVYFPFSLQSVDTSRLEREGIVSANLWVAGSCSVFLAANIVYPGDLFQQYKRNQDTNVRKFLSNPRREIEISETTRVTGPNPDGTGLVRLTLQIPNAHASPGSIHSHSQAQSQGQGQGQGQGQYSNVCLVISEITPISLSLKKNSRIATKQLNPSNTVEEYVTEYVSSGLSAVQSVFSSLFAPRRHQRNHAGAYRRRPSDADSDADADNAFEAIPSSASPTPNSTPTDFDDFSTRSGSSASAGAGAGASASASAGAVYYSEVQLSDVSGNDGDGSETSSGARLGRRGKGKGKVKGKNGRSGGGSGSGTPFNKGLLDIDYSVFVLGSEGNKAPQLLLQVGDELYAPQEVYGSETIGLRASTTSATAAANSTGLGLPGLGDQECLVCLSDVKEVLLLPCLHLCVCRECFIHIDKCPVCRAEFNEYVKIESEVIDDLLIPEFQPGVAGPSASSSSSSSNSSSTSMSVAAPTRKGGNI